jgi:hypothetical protein
LRERLEKAPSPPADSDLPGGLSLMAGRLLRLLEERKAHPERVVSRQENLDDGKQPEA